MFGAKTACGSLTELRTERDEEGDDDKLLGA